MEADLKPLEFEGIRRLLERLCATPFGADAARHLAPAPSIDAARRLQASITAARGGLESGEGPILPELPDVRAAIRQVAAPGAALAGTAFRNLARVLRVGEQLRPYVEKRPELLPTGPDRLDAAADLLPLIEAALLPNGSVREDGNAALRQLHGELKGAREQVQEALQGYLRRPGARIHWSGQRACLHLPDGVADQIRGVRRGAGPGGHGYLVEPMERVADNNRLERLAGAIAQENQAILRALSDAGRERLSGLQHLVESLTWVDLALAGAQLSIHLHGKAAEMVDAPVLVLEEAYHPQLILAYAEQHGPQPRPLSVHLDADCPILVITGPNSGGKSVSLKTVGLLTVMAHCGLHLPVGGHAVIGNFTRIFVDMGDPQSVAFALSTYSGHVEVLKRLLATADDHTLILLDELGTGTDPEEGAALAMAVLDQLAERGVRGMVTTHLAPLKAFADTHACLRNASMRFDQDRLEPTYELQIGVPGRSLGLLIAARRGLPEDLISKAQAYLARLHHH